MLFCFLNSDKNKLFIFIIHEHLKSFTYLFDYIAFNVNQILYY